MTKKDFILIANCIASFEARADMDNWHNENLVNTFKVVLFKEFPKFDPIRFSDYIAKKVAELNN